MAIIADSNILLRIADPDHPQWVTASRAIEVLRQRNERVHVLTQNFIEFWTVATRPCASANGLGMSPEMAFQELTKLKCFFALLPEHPYVFEEREELVLTYRVSGKPSHDARLVAAMRLHGISRILTFNVADLCGFQELKRFIPNLCWNKFF